MYLRCRPICTLGQSNDSSGSADRLRVEEENLLAFENQIDVMIHELKQPLLCILVLGERLEHVIRELTPEQTPKAAQMKRDVGALLVSVQQMREVMSARSAIANLQPVMSGWGKRISSQVEALTAIASSRGVEMDFDNRLTEVEAGPDLSAVGQVLSNFVNNAIQALDGLKEEPSRAKKLFVQLALLGDELEIQVHDSGNGVPAEQERRIFDRGFTTKSERGGSGYGLWVCKKLADALGGSVQVGPSERLEGACFSLRVPHVDARDVAVVDNVA